MTVVIVWTEARTTTFFTVSEATIVYGEATATTFVAGQGNDDLLGGEGDNKLYAWSVDPELDFGLPFDPLAPLPGNDVTSFGVFTGPDGVLRDDTQKDVNLGDIALVDRIFGLTIDADNQVDRFRFSLTGTQRPQDSVEVEWTVGGALLVQLIDTDDDDALLFSGSVDRQNPILAWDASTLNRDHAYATGGESVRVLRTGGV